MKKIAPGVRVTRVRLSVGMLELFRFDHYAHAFPRHAHERFTLGVFGPRNGSISVRGSAHRARQGSILAIAPEEIHSAEPLRGSGWTYRSLYPSSDVMSAALGPGTRELPRFDQPVIENPGLARSVDRLHRRLEDGVVTPALEERLLVLIRRLVRHGRAWAEPREDPATEVVSRARSFLEDRAADPVRLHDLSVHCGVSPFHLIRSFQRVLGMPPHAWLTQLRANRARALLLGGEAPTVAAYRCGFADQSHLTRTFRGIFGVTPGAYVRGTLSRSTGP